MTLINCEVSLILNWSENCVINSLEKREIGGTNNRNNSPKGARFTIKDVKLYVPVVTLSAENYNKLLEKIKAGFKRTITWNKYGSEMSNQTRDNNLNYLIDRTI